jgi:hypothetical protein
MRCTVSPAAASSRGDGIGAVGATTTTMPMPQLKVRSISASATPPAAASQAKTAGRARRRVDRGAEAVGQHARQVLGQAAAGDVGEGVHAAGADRGEQRAHVDAGGFEQRLAEGRVGEGGGRVPGEAGVGDDAAHEAEAVGVDPRGGEAEQDVASATPSGRAVPRSIAPTAKPARSKSPARRGRASRRSRRRRGRSRRRGSRRRCRRSTAAAASTSRRPVAK